MTGDIEINEDAITSPVVPGGDHSSYVDPGDAFWIPYEAGHAHAPLPVRTTDELKTGQRRTGTAAFEAQACSERFNPAFGGDRTLAAYRPTKPFLTTREATAYCGFKTASALRKAKLEGRIAPQAAAAAPAP